NEGAPGLVLRGEFTRGRAGPHRRGSYNGRIGGAGGTDTRPTRRSELSPALPQGTGPAIRSTEAIMRTVLVLVILPQVVLPLSGRAAAPPLERIMPALEPLAVLVSEARALGVLQIESVNGDTVAFQSVAVLKGGPESVPFNALRFPPGAALE